MTVANAVVDRAAAVQSGSGNRRQPAATALSRQRRGSSRGNDRGTERGTDRGIDRGTDRGDDKR
eukprot:7121862-Alexandrium_andersonii.AAC.1